MNNKKEYTKSKIPIIACIVLTFFAMWYSVIFYLVYGISGITPGALSCLVNVILIFISLIFMIFRNLYIKINRTILKIIASIILLSDPIFNFIDQSFLFIFEGKAFAINKYNSAIYFNGLIFLIILLVIFKAKKDKEKND